MRAVSVLIKLWNDLFAPRDWYPFTDPVTKTWRMRRWIAGGWEFREATAEEQTDAEYFWAIR